MKRQESGFTIIETVLVLAIAGLVISMILVGITNSLNQQRYLDAVNQAVDFFRGSYAVGSSSINDRPDTQLCVATGISETGNPATGNGRGASDCILVGKILRSSDGSHITVNQVVALHDPSNDDDVDALSDTAILQAANLIQNDTGKEESYDMESGTILRDPGASEAAQFTIMVVHVPLSGVVRTYSSNSATTSIADLLASADSIQDTRLCIDESGFFGIGSQPMGIAIEKDASNTTGVQIIPAGSCV